VDHPPFRSAIPEHRKPGFGTRERSELEALKNVQEKFRRFSLQAAGHTDIEYESWYLHGLGIPRIEDRRYDVVISFHIQHPFLCFYAI
jgi:hypothetical protein